MAPGAKVCPFFDEQFDGFDAAALDRAEQRGVAIVIYDLSCPVRIRVRVRIRLRLPLVIFWVVSDLHVRLFVDQKRHALFAVLDGARATLVTSSYDGGLPEMISMFEVRGRCTTTPF